MAVLKFWDGTQYVPILGGQGLDQATADARYVNVTGDTMTGNLRVTGATGGGGQVSADGVGSGGYSEFALYRDGVPRWYIRTSPGAASTEADLQIISRNDDGSPKATLLTLDRSSDEVKVYADPISLMGVATKQYVDNGSSAMCVNAGSWTNYITPTMVTRSGPIVALNGWMRWAGANTTVSAGVQYTVATIPVGFRPSDDWGFGAIFSVGASNTTFVAVRGFVYPDGSVAFYAPASATMNANAGWFIFNAVYPVP